MASKLIKGIDWGTELTAKFVNYNFVDAGETHRAFGEDITSGGFLSYEMKQFRLAFDIYSSFLNLHFLEVNQAGKANFNIMSVTFGDGTLGMMMPPADKSSGFGLFNHYGAGWDFDAPGSGGLEQGGFGFITIIHELGHALGLAHPHDKGGSSSVFPGVGSTFGDYGDFDLNQGVYTIMSYNDGWQTNPDGVPPDISPYGYQGTPMAIDIAALQKKYGINNAYHTGDDTYVLPSVNDVGTFYSCVWDAGGKDTISAGSDLPASIDLRAATLKVEAGGGGFISYCAGIYGGVTIANGVKIENAIGGGGEDYLRGNTARNELIGGGGIDTIIAGAGKDRMFGDAGDDIISGGKGRDKIAGGNGNDMLTGDDGRDTFIFDTAPHASTNIDTIADFTAGVDRIKLDLSVFSALGGFGTLNAARFYVGAAAHDGDDQIIYDSGTGALLYDADGLGGVAAVEFARLSAGLALTNTDFIVTA